MEYATNHLRPVRAIDLFSIIYVAFRAQVQRISYSVWRCHTLKYAGLSARLFATSLARNMDKKHHVRAHPFPLGVAQC